uniref:Peptidase M13 C-terminal domain-containing protein n=1 Tax=viral metagenome TaxID=1070528 RepID=A0A6C0HHX3_9ZZZZ
MRKRNKKFTKKISKTNSSKNNGDTIKPFTKKIKHWHKVIKLPHDKTTTKDRKFCTTDKSISKICESGKFSQYTEDFYNKANIETFNSYVTQIDDKYAKYKHIKIPMEKRTQYLIDKFRNITKKSNTNKDMIKDNFYDYVNRQWAKETIIEDQPKFYVQVDNFRIVQEKVYYQLIEYIKKYIKQHPTSEKAKAIKNLYNSLSTDTSVKALLKHCKEILSEFDDYINPNTATNVYDALADINRNEIISWGAPIQWQILPDEKDVTKYISHLSSAQLSIYDYLIYIDDPADNNETKKYKSYIKYHFFKFINETFEVCLGDKDHGYKPQDVWDVELELLDAMGCLSVKNDNPDFYNVVTSDEIENTYGFDWTEFTRKLGYKETPKKIIVSSLNSLKCTMTLLKEKWNTPKWKTYWLYIHYRQIIRFEPKYNHIHFIFFKHILEGQPVEMPHDIRPIIGLSMCFNTFLTEQYIEHNYNPLYVDYVQHLATDLKTLFIYKIERNTWLSPSTKKTALNKLKQLKLVVGSPNKLRYDPLFDYKADDSWYNLRLLTQWKHKRYISLEGKDVIDIPEIDWQEMKLTGTQAYMVNAYYRPTSNSIYVPLAYLQPPFIDLKERGLEYNLAFIGYTIAHELSHCLDDNGSKFDENGNLNNWWTDHDKKIFQAKIKDVVNQYETVAKRDGIVFDAEIGVGEDLADISGMSLVEEYLRDYSVINNDIDIIRYINLRQLYIYLAIQGKQKIFKKAIKAQLKINPHPLEKYRVNCPLSRLPVFRAIFEIKKGDGMWWHNTDSIW